MITFFSFFLFVGWVSRIRSFALLCALLCSVWGQELAAQFYPHPFETNPGTVGLTLSGGGARGFAHIGLLHVIDSLGLQVDYISGTSMGAIVGGLYAAGYSAREIEELALTIDWERVFGARQGLEYVHPRNRRQSGKSMLELPLERGRIRLTTGAIEGEQLWNILEDLFFHVRTEHDFYAFPIPFACVATDIETGEAIVMKGGDIVSALRASMAIPAVFSAVSREGFKLIDGGVVNNFPVDVVKSLGAEYVIGMYVSEGLKPAERLRTPLDIIYQMGFFKDAFMLTINRELTDLYMEPDLDGYTAASFGQVAGIIEAGKQMARKHAATLAVVATNNPQAASHGPQLSDRRVNNIVVDTVIYQGLDNVRVNFLMNLAQISLGETVSINRINRVIERFYATDYFDRVTYTYEPSVNHPDLYRLIFTFTEKPFSRLQAGLHYSSFAGVGIIGGISSSKFLLYNLNAHARARIGEQPAFQAGFDFYTDERQQGWVSLQWAGDVVNFPVYDRFEAIGRYRQRYMRTEATLNRLVGPNTILSGGAATYRQRLVPTMRTDLNVRGKNSGYELFSAYNIYTLNRHALPQRGQNLSVKATLFLGQDPEISIVAETGEHMSLQEMDIRIRNFLQLTFNWESYVPVHPRLTVFTHLQGGYNFRYTQGFINMFNLGGTNPFMRDQLVFAGLNEYEVMTASVLTAALGWRYNVWSDFYLTPVFNMAVYDFDQEAGRQTMVDRILIGGGINFGFLSPAGPLKTTVSYSPQTNRLIAYINLGWTF